MIISRVAGVFRLSFSSSNYESFWEARFKGKLMVRLCNWEGILTKNDEQWMRIFLKKKDWDEVSWKIRLTWLRHYHPPVPCEPSGIRKMREKSIYFFVKFNFKKLLPLKKIKIATPRRAIVRCLRRSEVRHALKNSIASKILWNCYVILSRCNHIRQKIEFEFILGLFIPSEQKWGGTTIFRWRYD